MTDTSLPFAEKKFTEVKRGVTESLCKFAT